MFKSRLLSGAGKIAFFISFVLFRADATASFNRSAGFDKAMVSIFDFNFTESAALLKKEIQADPGNSLLQVASNYSDFLENISKERPELYLRYKKDASQRYGAVEADGNKRSSPYYLYSLAIINFQTALLKLKNEDYIPGVYDLNQAYRQLKECLGLFPSFVPAKEMMGAATIIASLTPDNYKWFLKLNGICYDREAGTRWFKEAGDSITDKSFGNPVWMEYACVEYFVITLLGDDPDSIGKLDKSLPAGSASPLLMVYLKAKIGAKLGLTDRSILLLKSLRQDRYDENFPYLWYLYGSLKLCRLDADACEPLLRYVKQFRGKNYMVSANQKLSWYYLLNGQTEKFRQYRLAAVSKNEHLVYEDKQASRESKEDSTPDVNLIRARLLFDGRYYLRSLEVLNSIKPGSLQGKRHNTEYAYRVARDLQLLPVRAKAEELYRLVISGSGDEKWYYAANSALQLGLMEEQDKNYPLAIKYFDLCLSYKDIEYEESIHAAARACKARIMDKNH